MTKESSNRITMQEIVHEIVHVDAPTAYDVVDRLHRSWWRDVTAGASGNVSVHWSNNQKIGDGTREALRQVPSGEILLMEYLRSRDAVARFGPEAQGGAIIVTRR